MLDYDGTLAPFVPLGGLARPWPFVAEVLPRLIRRPDFRLVVVSGRPARQAAELLGLDPSPEIFGCHGADRLSPSGEHIPYAPGPSEREGIAAATEWAELRRYAVYLETKPCGLALHVRGLPRTLARELLAEARTAWAALADRHGLAAHDFDGGVELRPRGIDKGRAVRKVLGDTPDEAFVTYLGDDATDEDAFTALGERGLSVLVRREARPTAATLRLVPPLELAAFLEHLLASPPA